MWSTLKRVEFGLGIWATGFKVGINLYMGLVIMMGFPMVVGEAR